MATKPEPKSSLGDKELDKVEKQFDAFDENVKSLTLNRMNLARKEELEPQTKISQSDINKMVDVYLKPFKTVACRDKFNEKYREAYNFDKEYVHFTAENKECIGETIELWTRPYSGMPAEFWQVPTNKPIWGPRYLAEQINRKSHHRLMMEEKAVTGSHAVGQDYGKIVVDKVIPRLTASPVSKKLSIFMGANSF